MNWSKQRASARVAAEPGFERSARRRTGRGAVRIGTRICREVFQITLKGSTRRLFPVNPLSRRADSNRGPLHYESRPKVEQPPSSPLQSLQALRTSQNRGLGRTAKDPKVRNGVRLVFGRGAPLSGRSHVEAQGGPSPPATREHLLTVPEGCGTRGESVLAGHESAAGRTTLTRRPDPRVDARGRERAGDQQASEDVAPNSSPVHHEVVRGRGVADETEIGGRPCVSIAVPAARRASALSRSYASTVSSASR